MKIKFTLFIVIALILLSFLSYPWGKNVKKDLVTTEPAFQSVKIKDIGLNAEVADTNARRTEGLSGKNELGENEGMLFVFEKEGNYKFWMKGMNFPIDIAWIDKNKTITHIEKNISPETYPEAFGSPKPSLYVLETAAEFFGKNNIKIGDDVAF